MESREKVLRQMKICRFCLCEEEPLTSIYVRETKDNKEAIKQSVPLPLQLMACVAIEVFENDGMPQLICTTCQIQTQQAYNFKANCKKADDALKVFLATGNLQKPWTAEELKEIKKNLQPGQVVNKRPVEQSSGDELKATKRPKREVEFVSVKSPIKNQNKEASTSHKGKEEVLTESETDQDDDNQHDDYEDYEEFSSFEEESMLNPVLKVKQVRTECFPCPQCSRSFPLKQLLDLHMSNHSRERNFNCEDCDKAFFTKYDLSKHLHIHTGTKPYVCSICNKTFRRESLLHRHEKIHVDVPKYLCSECDKTFLTGEDLDAHIVKHKKKRPYACVICNKSFVFKQGLERHELSHSTVKPHKCNYCEASFTSAIKLTRHVTSHAGLRPYPCKMCGRTFLLSHHLTRHMRNHYAANQPDTFVPVVGQYKCDTCSMSFRRKDSLINHSAIHSMVNLKCVICNTEFDNVAKVKEHITTHLSDLPFPCEKCDYSFETQEQLEDHELKHAEMEYEEQIEQEVFEEARQAYIGETNTVDEGDWSVDDVAEFTITSDTDNQEVVRRSARQKKVKNYPDFLKDDMDSDEDGNENEEEAMSSVQDSDHHDGEVSQGLDDDTIKPIVRSEGTKVYKRKNTPDRSKTMPRVNVNPMTNAPLSSKTVHPHTLESLEEGGINKISDKEIFNMKIGDKTVTVQKLLLTREQMKAMAKEGKIEKKGNTLLLKKKPGQSLPNISLDSLFGKTTPIASSSVKKMYERKSTSSADNEPVTINSMCLNSSSLKLDESSN